MTAHTCRSVCRVIDAAHCLRDLARRSPAVAEFVEALQRGQLPSVAPLAGLDDVTRYRARLVRAVAAKLKSTGKPIPYFLAVPL